MILSMFEIIEKNKLNSSVTMMKIKAPFVAKKAQAGQFIILRVCDDGERIPLTIAGYDRAKGTVDIIFQVVGGTTMLLDKKERGEFLTDFVGPLGNASELEGVKNACIIGGGVGCAIALPVANRLHELGANVTSIIGFRNKDLVILEKEFEVASTELYRMSDDGSWGEKGLVTEPLKNILSSGNRFDVVIAIGPLIMMKFVASTTKEFAQKTVVSMNPIMIDGTGMCGGCRLTVKDSGGKPITKFACVDGPEFDAFSVDFDEAILRNRRYGAFETHARESACNLLSKAVK